MVERLSVTTESWRPQRRGSVFDPQIRRTALLAVGGIAVVALGIAGYVATSRRSAGIPVIEADSRPLRVKPDNPGGLQIIGVDEQSGVGQSDVMAAPPEAPQPQSLRAQIQAARQAAAPPPAPAVTAASQPPASVSQAPASQASEPQPAASPVLVPNAPAQRVASPPVIARPPAAHPPVIAAPPSLGGTEVQLAALESERAAMTEWARLSKRMPELLASHHPSVIEAQRDDKTFYRLRTGGFGDVAHAAAFCAQVKSKGGGCAIASF